MGFLTMGMRPAAPLYEFAQRRFPTNCLARAVSTRRGLRWGPLVALLGCAYLFVAAVLFVMVRDGGPGWLNILALVACWNFLKLVGHGLRATVALFVVRARESSAVRKAINAELRLRRASGENVPGPTRQERRALVALTRREILKESRT